MTTAQSGSRWQELSATDASLMAEIARLIPPYVDSSYAFIEECLNSPEAGSRLAAAVSVASETLLETYYASAWHLTAAADHLQTLAAAIHDGFAPRVGGYTLVRGCAEGSSIASWLLAEALTEQERAARGLAERVEMLISQQKLMNDQAHFDARIVSVRSSAGAAGIAVNDSRAGIPYKFDNEIFPNKSDLIEQHLQEMLNATGRDQRWFYGFLSGFAHSSRMLHQAGASTTVDAAGRTVASPATNVGWIVGSLAIGTQLYAHVLGLLARASGKQIVPTAPIIQ
jgi:hypothetical protein